MANNDLSIAKTGDQMAFYINNSIGFRLSSDVKTEVDYVKVTVP